MRLLPAPLRVVVAAVALVAVCTARADSAVSIAPLFKSNPAWVPADDVVPLDGGTRLEVTPGNSGNVLVITNAKAKAPQLRSQTYFGDCVVSAEYLFTDKTAAAIFLASAYRIQLDGPAGTIGTMHNYDGPPYPPIAAKATLTAAPGVWHTIEARLRAARYSEASGKSQNGLLMEVKVDGVVVQSNTILPGWSIGTETEWETTGGNVTFSAQNGSLAIRNVSLQRVDFSEIALPAQSGGETNAGKLIDYVQAGAALFKGLGCVECHAVKSDDNSQKTGPNLFGLFQVEPRDREIAAGEGHRFTVKADRAYLQRSVRTPWEELAVAERGEKRGEPYLPAMPPILPTVASDAQVDQIYAYLLTLNESAQQGPVIKLVKETGLENYDPLADRLQFLVDQRVRIQRGPIPGASGRAIHVGLPGGINYTFDPRRLAIVQLWQGGFLDMSGELLNRGGAGLKPGYESREIKLGNEGTLLAPLNAAGEAVDFSFVSPIFHDTETVRAALNDPRDISARLAAIDAQFLGYERDSTQPTAAPVFKYRVGKNTIAVGTAFSTDGTVRIDVTGQFATAQSFGVNSVALGGVKTSAGTVANGRWTIPAGKKIRATLTAHVSLAPNPWHPPASTFVLSPQKLETEAAQPVLPRGYTAESYLPPKDNYGRVQLFEALGMALAPDGTIVVATRTAGIWRLVKGEWRLFAEGLFDSLGVQVEDEHGLVVVAGQKAELTRISDTNGDGVADRYDTITDAFGYTGNYHAYLHGPIRDPKGGYLFTLNLNDTGENTSEYKAGGRYMGTSGGYRGWAMRSPPKGGIEPYADGLRSPASLGVAPDGRVWYADNQGEYVGTSKIFVLRRGGFYGHPAGLVDRPGMTPSSPEIAWDRVLGQRESAVVLLPQGRLANSPGNPAWDTTGGRFGPFGGQMLIGDQTQSNLMRIVTERVGAHEQGSAINFATKLASGVMRPLFLPDGSLLLGQTGRGWQAKGGNIASLQHVRWDGHTVAPAIHHVAAAEGGFDLILTAPIPATVADLDLKSVLAVKSWVYRDAPDYGSPELDERVEPIAAVTLNAERNRLHVDLAETSHPSVHPQQTARVYRLTLDGKKLWDEAGPGNEAFYTLYEFPVR